ncbi:hypothetical protein A2924_01105 [Candidatus Giovannonibacteria bacterium RIFCSPLOWO2_01_FULL_44_16]|uniref:Uncharacterized protein n=1 Tax=Candidatus Giovannonibacteria bacterium RIFCSPLOWO2_01_FULL_44_16 TaxID=1798348 RepID=A0A1F5X4X9_9BACT|nr:MAG: hypothetical protein A2924_01105 [Candidatus Giovannonibacteria bacterium RIFCSPLOWO2_01_FULL_44_16]
MAERFRPRRKGQLELEGGTSRALIRTTAHRPPTWPPHKKSRYLLWKENSIQGKILILTKTEKGV